MIKVLKIKVREFRGIRQLTLDLKGKNFAISGPNGTGKSGIVDSVEFGLTGSVSRLTGKGRGDLSVKDHGPHVDSRAHPDKAVVELEIEIPKLKKTARIVRTVKNPNNPVITPADPDIIAALKRVEAHPEFALSRREIIKYVITEPGERSKAIQALLQLDDIEAGRLALQKIANATEKEVRPLESSRIATRDALLRALQIVEATPEAILSAVNVRRAVLGLPALVKLEPTTSIRDGLDSLAAAAQSRVNKQVASADLQALRDNLEHVQSAEFTTALAAASATLAALQGDEALLGDVSRDALLEEALDQFDGEHCPVCETAWEPERFRAIVTAQRQKLETANGKRREAEALLAPIIEAMRTLQGNLNAVAAHGPRLSDPIDASKLTEFENGIAEAIAPLQRLLPLAQAMAALKIAVPADVGETVSALRAAIVAIPEPTDRDAARDYLIIGQERLEAYRAAAIAHEAGKRRSALAAKVFEMYGTSTTKALNTIYEEVEQQFRAFYRSINSDDESAFEARLTPSVGKLDFSVDFYGRGFFPPGAYHSEGHQDGMGLCLYLALMKHLLAIDFTFAVLDDVLMSVDTGHRRQVCTLLVQEFPNTQFILTTHDGVWLRHMKTAGLVGSDASIEFRKWDVDQGPTDWQQGDFWAEIDGYLASGDTRAAAALLRNGLEYLSGEFGARLGARVEYKLDGRYDLGDLLPSAASALRDLLKKGKAAATSWADADLLKAVSDYEAQLAEATKQAFVEQWLINPSVHFNELIAASKEEFAVVVAAFKRLMAQFVCPKCNGALQLVRVGKDPSVLRCPCAKVSLNLAPKKGGG